MTFTLVSQLREQLSTLVRTKQEDEIRRAHEKERLLLEVRLLCAWYILTSNTGQKNRKKKRGRVGRL